MDETKTPKSLFFDVTNLDGSVTTYSYEWSHNAVEQGSQYYRNLFLAGEILDVKSRLGW